MQMEYDKSANIYTYAKLYHNKRPGIWSSAADLKQIYHILTYLPNDLNLLKCTEIRSELEDITTVTPDLYSKICSNGNISSNLNANNSIATSNGVGTVVVKMGNSISDENEDDSIPNTESNNVNV